MVFQKWWWVVMSVMPKKKGQIFSGQTAKRVWFQMGKLQAKGFKDVQGPLPDPSCKAKLPHVISQI